MFLHLGNDRVISGEKLIAILNLEGATAEPIEKMLADAGKGKRLIKISSKDKNKSLVVCDDRLYISPISSHTLYKRSIQNRAGGLINE